MGRALIQAVAATEDMQLSGAAEAPSSPMLGQDAGAIAGCYQAAFWRPPILTFCSRAQRA